MNNEIFVIAEQFKGKLSEVTFEMLGKAAELATLSGGKLRAVIVGRDITSLVARLGIADSVITIEHELLAEFNPEAYQLALSELLNEKQPALTFVGSTSMGLDIAAPLSARLQMPLVAYCNDVRSEGGKTVVISQLYGGKMSAEVELHTMPAILSILPGAFHAEKGMLEKNVPVEQYALKTSLDAVRMRVQRLIEPAAGDVDITQVPVLVSVGRGIQNQENVEVVKELADALGGAVCASRPVVDQGWLPMTRQVGRSGMIVKPKLYLSLGISGAPEHCEGMRDAELKIAINTDPKAPIFAVSHYGAVADVMDIVPRLTEEIKHTAIAG